MQALQGWDAGFFARRSSPLMKHCSALLCVSIPNPLFCLRSGGIFLLRSC